MSIAFRRAWLLINIIVTVALLPLLFPNQGDGSATAVNAGAGALERRVITANVPSTILIPTTTTTAPPPPTAVARRPAARTVTRAVVKPTPKPRPSVTATPPAPAAAAPAASGSESGRATWYDYKPGICAHKTLPFGTVVTVNAVNGKSVQCTVGDRGPFVEGYVIDLNAREFEQLAPRSTGRIDVTITW